MAKNNTGAAIGVGVGVAAAAAAAGGAYWLWGAPHSAKHRKMAKAWMLKARAEVLEGIEKIEDIDRAKYMQLAANVVKNYTGRGTPEEIAQMMKDFKAAWGHMQAKKPAKAAKKAVKKAVKKAKKAASKNRR